MKRVKNSPRIAQAVCALFALATLLYTVGAPWDSH